MTLQCAHFHIQGTTNAAGDFYFFTVFPVNFDLVYVALPTSVYAHITCKYGGRHLL